MYIIISSSELLRKLTSLKACIASKPVTPILSAVLMQVDGTNLTLLTSNSETEMRTSMQIIESDGTFRMAMELDTLHTMLSSLGEQPVTITDNGNMIELKHSTGIMTLFREEANDYPTIPGFAQGAQVSRFSMPADTFKATIQRLGFIAEYDELRPQLHCMYIDTDGDHSLTCVATHGKGFGLGMSTHKMETPVDNVGIMLPIPVAKMARNVLGKEQLGEIIIESDGYRMIVTTPDYVINSRVLEGRYPNYRSVIPECSIHATMDKLGIKGVLNRALIIIRKSKDAANAVRFEFNGNTLHVHAESFDQLFKADEDIEIDYDGEPMNIGINATLLIQILDAIPGDRVTVSMAGPQSAMIWSPAPQGDTEEVQILLTPMAV